MAKSARRAKRAPESSIKDTFRAGPSPALEGLVFKAFGLTAGIALGLSSEARGWFAEALGYGWIPAGIWLVATLATLRYHRRFIVKYWKWWAMAAAVAAVAIGILSFFPIERRFVTDSGLSGTWGAKIGGSPMALAIVKLGAISVSVPLMLFPKRLGPIYLKALRHIGQGLRFVPLRLGFALFRGVRFADRQLKGIFEGRFGSRWLAGRRSGKAPELDGSIVSPDADDETFSLWSGSSPGSVPAWDFDDELPTAGGTSLSGLGGVSRERRPAWRLPTVDLLSPPDPHEATEAPLRQMARLVETTLADHGVAVEVKDIKSGPRIVRFGLVPGWVPKKGDSGREEAADGKAEGNRVKVQSILMREKDLALALKTPHLRIEAPVPGEALVGLEVPSPSPSKVHLREVMETPAFGFLAAKGGLPVALGMDTGGSPVVMDLAALPHMLIAGATGSGKSVCINSIVATLLLTKPPDQLRLLMVDPKRVELTPFNGIPHLIAPVIVDAEEVNTALRSLMREMLVRYKQLEEAGARNITGYNSKTKDRLPYLVLVVDELADLMMTGGFEVEQNLVRLSQLGRATGIHLVLATQRPSVNVVTGLLKANIATRAAFAVASQVDSRVILDAIGAEKLLGKGDMLLLHGESPKPRRVQGTLVYETEIDHLVDFWTRQEGPPLPAIPIGGPEGYEEDEDDQYADDQMMDDARDLALRNPRLSTSLLERRLKIGGRRAAQIIETLEEEGLVAPR